MRIFSLIFLIFTTILLTGVYTDQWTHTVTGRLKTSRRERKEYNQLCWQSQDGCGLHTIISKRPCENSLHLCGRHNCGIRSRNNLNHKPSHFSAPDMATFTALRKTQGNEWHHWVIVKRETGENTRDSREVTRLQKPCEESHSDQFAWRLDQSCLIESPWVS